MLAFFEEANNCGVLFFGVESMEYLTQIIENKRDELLKASKSLGLSCPLIIKLSQELDELLNIYDRERRLIKNEYSR